MRRDPAVDSLVGIVCLQRFVFVDTLACVLRLQASEYHLYYAMLKTGICSELQATIVPKDAMTPTTELDSTTNPKTIWWAWCPDAPTHTIEELLAQQVAQTPHADSGMDFSKSLKLGSPGQQVRDEVECAQRLRSGGRLQQSVVSSQCARSTDRWLTPIAWP